MDAHKDEEQKLQSHKLAIKEELEQLGAKLREKIEQKTAQKTAVMQQELDASKQLNQQLQQQQQAVREQYEAQLEQQQNECKPDNNDLYTELAFVTGCWNSGVDPTLSGYTPF